MQQLIIKLRDLYPKLKFTPGEHFCWSPETSEIIYVKKINNKESFWSLLHETGHALLNHNSYTSDFELIKLELAAWEEAKIIAKKLDLEIDENHIQDCLDTYRNWLHKRSICPNCTAKCLQQDDIVHYRCFNCHTAWKVTSNRFCRAYRSTKNIPKNPILVL